MTSHTVFYKISALCVVVLVTQPLSASDPQPIHWTATATAAALPIKKGSKVVTKVTATIAPGWHLYAFDQQPGGPLPTSLSVASGQPYVSDGNIGESDPKTEFDSNFNLPTSLFESKAVFTVPVKAVSTATESHNTVKVDVAYQTCNDRMCLPLTVVHLTAEIHAGKVH